MVATTEFVEQHGSEFSRPARRSGHRFASNLRALLRSDLLLVSRHNRRMLKIGWGPCRSNPALQIRAQSRFLVPSLHDLQSDSTKCALLFPPSFEAADARLSGSGYYAPQSLYRRTPQRKCLQELAARPHGTRGWN